MDRKNVITLASDSKPVLTPFQALARYRDELSVKLADNTLGILPGVIGTIFFERGSQPQVRQAILDCFDQFNKMFGEKLNGGKDSDRGKFTKRNVKGVEKIHRAITDTPSNLAVSVLHSSAVDQDVAADYNIEVLTGIANPKDYVSPRGWAAPKGQESGLSHLKFNVPMDLITTDAGLSKYEEFLHLVCNKLVVRGGYGGLAPILPFSYHRYMPQEWALAERFSGLEIDSTAHLQKRDYDPVSYEGDSTEAMTAFYPDLHPGAKVARWGFIKGVNWYTILGELFIDRLGGEDAIREKLDRPDIHIERANACLMIRAGDFPRLGAPEEGLPEPYVFVNSVLRVLRDPKPDALHTYIPDLPSADVKNARAWAARFDLPDAPPIPEPPTIVPQPVKREPARRSVRGGSPCPEAGWWLTPAKPGSRRYFETGEIMPVIEGSSWGTTSWHWSPDENQGG
ncbi:type VI immunity family protein [Burkholderia gladioli]|uniref:type VI immunity family protein n=1 Tax=Burkholderia gladioli TaxID=28095 RepID=UPI001640C805|nr:type VI immunity family protein [Burkholderia gladioli]